MRLHCSQEAVDACDHVTGSAQRALRILGGGFAVRQQPFVGWITASIDAVQEDSILDIKLNRPTACLDAIDEFQNVVSARRPFAFFQQQGFESLFDSLLTVKTDAASLFMTGQN